MEKFRLKINELAPLSLAIIAFHAGTSETSLALPKDRGDVSPLISESELHERRVDQAALDSQINAIRKLQDLLKKHRGTEQEPLLLFKLGEAQRQAGSMQFRITYGTNKAASHLNAHKAYLQQSTVTFTELIRRFPRSPDLGRAYFLRGRSHEQAGAPEHASADYLHLVRNFPKSEDTVSAYMSLAQIAMDKNQWAPASDYLQAVENHADSPHYPHALYKAAWCQYNLRDIPRALSYIERNIRYYSDGKQSRSDEALRENAIQDAALFFLEGYEQKLSHFGVEYAYSYFKRLDSGPLLGKMLLRYAKLLRAHGHAKDLAEWKTLVLREEPRRPESFDVIVTAYEDQLNKRQYLALVLTARDLVAHRNPKSPPESRARAEKLLLDAAQQLQALITRNKDADGVTILATALTGLYDSFTQLVDEKDPRIPKAHFNLAESMFEVRQFEEATEHYRWVVEHGDWKTVENSSVRAIASRYELLRKRNLVPGNLKARAPQESEPRELDPQLDEWIGWIDAHIEKAGMTVDNFYFEANRCIYAHGDTRVAVNRMREFALKYPKSKYATPSATLVVDTLVAGGEWEKLRSLANELLAQSEWKGSEFAKRLYALASDAEFKAVEAAYRSGDHKMAIRKAEEFLSQYPESARKADCLAVAGHAALSDQNRSKAMDYFGQLMRSAPGTEAAASALLAEASMREDQFEFSAAARNYQQYLALPSSIAKINDSQRLALRKKTLVFAWISGESQQLHAILRDKNICTPSLATECERYELFEYFEKESQGRELTAKAFSRARRSPTELRPLWAALALQGARHLAFRDRHVAIRLLTRHWQELDSLTSAFILPSVTENVPRAIALNRRDIRAVAPLFAREAYLVRRMEAIREIENAGIEATKLPWARIRAAVTNELADVYADSARNLASLQGASPAMAEPFNRKSDELRAKAFQLASTAAIEPDAFDAIAQPYLHADPKRMAALLPKEPLPKPTALDPDHLRSLDPDGEWGSIKNEWYRAVRQKRWNEAIYLIQNAKERKTLPPGALALLRAYTLAGIGAQAEALAELAGARDGLAAKTRRNINRLLLEHYQSSLAHERARKLVEEMRNDGESVARWTAQGTGG